MRKSLYLFIFLGSIALPMAARSQTYTYTDLGAYYVPTALNNCLTSGVSTTYVVGTYEPSSGSNYPFYIIRTGGVWSSPALYSDAGSATGVNDTGWMCGYVNPSGPNPNQGFTYNVATSAGGVWPATEWYDYVGAPDNPYGTINELKFAYGITNVNSSGYAFVAGWDDVKNMAFQYAYDTSSASSSYETDGAGDPNPYAAWTNTLGDMTAPSGSRAYAINKYGAIAGFFYGYSGYVTGTSLTWNPVPISSGGYVGGTAWAINSSGVIAGGSSPSFSSSQAYIFTPGGDASFLGSSSVASAAYGINDQNSAVGSMVVSGSAFNHAFIAYGGSTTLSDLNSMIYGGLPTGVTLVQANAVNNDVNGTSSSKTGFIVGTSQVSTKVGKLTTWVLHGFLLTPHS